MSTHGPDTGLRSRIEAKRLRQRLLEIDGHPSVIASPETVARLVSAQAYLALGLDQQVTLDLGGGPKSYSAGDLDLLLGLCGEAFSRYDTPAAE
jgi:hypothetical protein